MRGGAAPPCCFVIEGLRGNPWVTFVVLGRERARKRERTRHYANTRQGCCWKEVRSSYEIPAHPLYPLIHTVSTVTFVLKAFAYIVNAECYVYTTKVVP